MDILQFVFEVFQTISTTTSTNIKTRWIVLRGYLDGKEWVSVGDVLCLTKDEDLHRKVAKAMFNKCCTCDQRGKCALNKIQAIYSDFETGLWRAFLEELHKHQEE